MWDLCDLKDVKHATFLSLCKSGWFEIYPLSKVKANYLLRRHSISKAATVTGAECQNISVNCFTEERRFSFGLQIVCLNVLPSRSNADETSKHVGGRGGGGRGRGLGGARHGHEVLKKKLFTYVCSETERGREREAAVAS